MPVEYKLLDARGLLNTLFPDEASRPTVRWLRNMQKAKAIPFVKIGALVFFCPDQVREALERRTIKPRSSRAPKQQSIAA